MSLLAKQEIRLAKRSYGWPEDAKFLVPAGVREHFQEGLGSARATSPPVIGENSSMLTAASFPT